jgi:hypothetical protein
MENRGWELSMKSKNVAVKTAEKKAVVGKETSKILKGYRYNIPEKMGATQKRIMVGIPMTGTLRSEWVLARYGQVIPCNWSQVEFVQWIDQYSPIRYMVADARNIVVAEFLERGFEWLIFIDHDVVLPPLFLVWVNDYIIKGDIPIFGGLYFTKSVPSEPLVYRGRGNGYFAGWKLGEKVWVDGLGMGATVIHRSILQAVWDESEEYAVAGVKVRKVFETPQRIFFDPETQSLNVQTGTEDLEFLSRVMKLGILRKTGWTKVANRKYPFLVDTKLFCRHIAENGVQFPSRGEEGFFIPKGKKK